MPEGPIVRLLHQDCHYASALQWYKPEAVEKEMTTLWPIVRVGHLVAQNDQFVALAMAHTREDNEYEGIWWIPRCLIIEMETLTPAQTIAYTPSTSPVLSSVSGDISLKAS